MMSEPFLSVTETPSADELRLLSSELDAFNESAVGPSDRRALAVFVRVEDQVVAGLSGYTAWGWLYIQWLWVAEEQRGRRLARKLISAAEAEALARGCHGAHIDTFSPQALHVYQKSGYSVFGTLPDFPLGRTRSFLSKSLR